MNLAWIVAVLRPLDVAPHPNFRDAGYDTQPYARLAGIVSGDPHRSGYSADNFGDGRSHDLGVRHAEMSLTTQGIRVGLNGLVREILSDSASDHARLCALGLLACSAAAEMDEYRTCDRILDRLLEKTRIDTPEGKLLRAALLQQQSLRFRDSGRKHTSQTAETLGLLDEIDGSDFSDFPMSPGATVSQADSLSHVITALRHAAWSLVPVRLAVDEASELPPSFPTWQEMVRTQKSNQALRIDQLRAAEYSKFVEDSFNRLFRSQTRTIGGRGAPTLFYAALNYELLGDAAVYKIRKDNALMKLVQCMSSANPDPEEAADSLRLLRHANAKAEIDLAIERIRASGPLAALKHDSAQVLRNRAEPPMMRESELRILRGAADLMTQTEARSALALVRQVIEAGGAQPLPGSFQLDVVRLEPAWLTAAHLASVAEEDEQISLILLEAAQSGRPGDELWDKAIGRSLRQLDWGNISSSTHLRWKEFFETDPSLMPVSRTVFDALTSHKLPQEETVIHDLEDVANRVNAAMSGTSMSAMEVSTSVEIVRGALERIKAESVRGVFSFRSLDPADVAAALIVHADASELWPVLSEFLLDGEIQRSDKSGALDRLAYRSVELPPSVAETFRRDSGILLAAQSGHFDDDLVSPFPAALRFLAAHRIIDEPAVFSLIAQISGSAEPDAREQASRTVAVLASSFVAPWLLTQAMQLSHDAEPRVRAHAARALSLFSTSSSEFRESAEFRLVEMMAEEGILVPILVLRQMRDSDDVPDSAKRAVGVLAEQHQSVRVRKEARALLDALR
ncbi:hypothetical protein ACFW9V_10110 [Streptomyces hygroscopicus]|uniref:hypothetical protein n=1 Tax=Streptomyces hygroscopicus TaxID=1912 RepID=UPI0036CE94D7